MSENEQNTVEYWKGRAEAAERELQALRPGPGADRDAGLAQARKRGFIK